MADEPIDGAQNNTDAPGEGQAAEDTSTQAPVSSLLDTAGDEATEGEDSNQAEGSEGESAEGKEAAPEEYAEFQLPEGMPVDQDFMSQTKAAFKDAGLSQEKAQKLVDLVVERDKRVEEAQFKQADDWAKEFMKNPDAKKELAYAAKAREFVTPGLREMLKDPRIGNNPEILATFAKIGRMLSEDQMIDQGSRGGASEKGAAEVLFGDMLK
jgi:hypothetical protein